MEDVVQEGHSPINKVISNNHKIIEFPYTQTADTEPLDEQALCTSSVVDAVDMDSSQFDSASSENEIEDATVQCSNQETAENPCTEKVEDIPTYLKHSSEIPTDGDGDVMESENCEKEIEEDDLTSKLLLSIQVLPRIPKRKQQGDDSDGTPSAEKQSYRSVLERVETVTSRGMGSYSNWSTSGWKRTNDEKIADDRGTWNRKNDKKGRGKWSDRSKATHSIEFRSNSNDTLNNNDKMKFSRATKESVPTTFLEHNSQSGGSVDDDHKTSVETPGVPATGPLPTLPFEEQMRERAKLRSLQYANRLDASGTANTNDETPGSCYDTGSSTDVHGGSEESSVMTVENVSSHLNSRNNLIENHKPESRTSKTDRHSSTANCSENIEGNHRSVINKSNDGSSKKTNRSSKSNQPQLPRKVVDHHKTRRSEDIDQRPGHSTSESKSTASCSPPLPHLPVLPLFASVCSTDNTKSTAIDSLKQPASSSVKINGSTSGTDLKAKGSMTVKATAVSSKTVTFSCPEGAEKLAVRKGKHKKTLEKKSIKTTDKVNLQERVVKEMKNYLRPYYMRRQITKDEYKDIMRRAVPRICHDRQHEDIRASRIHKYASAYVDKVLKQSSGHVVELADNLGSANKLADYPPPPPYS